MRIAAVVPMKSLREAKGRLAGHLSPGERATLALGMLENTLDALTRSGAINWVGVISPNPRELDLYSGVEAIVQEREGLNNLLEQGRVWAVERGADALMVAFADLPLLLPGDVRNIARISGAGPSAVLAPDRHESGTNIVLANPASIARFAFGPGSFTRHRQLYEAAGAKVRVYRSAGTSLDIDTPNDLEMLQLERPALAGCARESNLSALQ